MSKWYDIAMNAPEGTRHVLGLSGGKDSAALAVYIKNEYPDLSAKMEYFFTDTGAELQEVYDTLERLEGYLGKTIERLSSESTFEHWLKLHNDYLPSPRQRWCTRKMKIEPFEGFVGDDPVISYIGIRADENREGYISNKATIKPLFPFSEDGIVRDQVFQMLEDSIGIPEYYEWRSRSGCYFCFFQRQDEWLGLKRRHPHLFEKAREIEQVSGGGYTWVQGMQLDDVVARAEEREREALTKGKKLPANKKSSQRWQDVLRYDEDDDDVQACTICSL